MSQWDYSEAEIEKQLIGIRIVSSLVDPIEHAAEHPFIQDIINFEFDDQSDVMRRLEHIAWEFMFSPDEIVKAVDIARVNQLEREI